ncbi:MAG: DUF6150 family protein [Bacteroides sp.]|jgi:hypothetical protein
MSISVPTVCLVLFTLLCTLSGRAQKFYQCEENETPDLKVWAAEKPKGADFNAYFVYDASELKGIGTVLQVPTREEADFSLQFVDNKKEADFSLWIVESAEEAGWKNKNKEHLFDKFLNKQ